MGWFDSRIDIQFKMHCLSCGYSFYPYCESWTFSRVPRDVFQTLQYRPCPKCEKYGWGKNL